MCLHVNLNSVYRVPTKLCRSRLDSCSNIFLKNYTHYSLQNQRNIFLKEKKKYLPREIAAEETKETVTTRRNTVNVLILGNSLKISLVQILSYALLGIRLENQCGSVL